MAAKACNIFSVKTAATAIKPEPELPFFCNFSFSPVLSGCLFASFIVSALPDFYLSG